MENKKYNKIKGNYGEEKAAQFLLQHGYKIIARNYTCVFGEVDIIAEQNEVLHFVEVKTRTADYIRGRVAVNTAKQNHIRKTASNFLLQNGSADKYFVSFDIIEITDGEIELLQNCFY
jgi:putative endonuclease